MILELPENWLPTEVAQFSSLAFFICSIIAFIIGVKAMRKENSKVEYVMIPLVFIFVGLAMTACFIDVHLKKQQEGPNLRHAVIEEAKQVYGIDLSNGNAQELIHNGSTILVPSGLEPETDVLYGKTETLIDGEITAIRLAFYDGEFVLLNTGSQDAVELERV